MEISTSVIAFIALIVVGIAAAIYGKIRLNTTLLAVGVIVALAGVYCLVSGQLSF